MEEQVGEWIEVDAAKLAPAPPFRPGDVLEKILRNIGFRQKSCGCAKRQAAMNRAWEIIRRLWARN